MTSLCKPFPKEFIFECDYVPTKREEVASFLRHFFAKTQQSPAKAVVIRPKKADAKEEDTEREDVVGTEDVEMVDLDDRDEIVDSDDMTEDEMVDLAYKEDEIADSDDIKTGSDASPWNYKKLTVGKRGNSLDVTHIRKGEYSSYKEMVKDLNENKRKLKMKFKRKKNEDVNSEEARARMDTAFNEYYYNEDEDGVSMVAESTIEPMVDNCIMRDGTLWGNGQLLTSLVQDDPKLNDPEAMLKLLELNEEDIIGDGPFAGISKFQSIVGAANYIFFDHLENVDLASCNQCKRGLKKWYFVYDKVYRKHTTSITRGCPKLLYSKSFSVNKAWLKEQIEADPSFNEKHTVYEYVQQEGEIVITGPGCVHGGYAVEYTECSAINFGTIAGSRVLDFVQEEIAHREKIEKEIEEIVNEWEKKEKKKEKKNKNKEKEKKMDSK